MLLGVRIVLSKPMSLSGIGDSIWVNLMLVAYCVYGAITAFLLPKIFFHQIELVPMGAAYLGPQPLAFSSQNITTAFYLIGTGFAAVAASLIAKDPRSPSIMVNTFIFVTWAHVATGIADLALTAVHMGDLLNIFRNGHYAQLTQAVMSVHRISGIMPEPSNYSAYGIVLLAIMSELWIRGVASRSAGPAALAMLVLLILTTSTTAYAGVGVYAITLIARILLVPAARGSRKALIVGGLLFASVFAGVGVMMLSPTTAQKAIDIIKFATVAKASSESGEQRASWARAGFEAFASDPRFRRGRGEFPLVRSFRRDPGVDGPDRRHPVHRLFVSSDQTAAIQQLSGEGLQPVVFRRSGQLGDSDVGGQLRAVFSQPGSGRPIRRHCRVGHRLARSQGPRRRQFLRCENLADLR